MTLPGAAGSARLISVIVVNWNGKHLLKECLECLKAQSRRNSVEIIVVDNASTDGSVEYLEQLAPEVKVVRLAENKGFAGGNLEGLKVATGVYVALLNNDARPDVQWLEELTDAMEEEPAVGICASRIVLQSHPDRLDSASDGCVTSGHGFKRGHGEASAIYMERGYVFGASAAAALYRKSMIEDIGFLDEDFFLNCEDTDLNFRAQLMGWKCLYVPSAVVLHQVSTSVRALSDVAVYYSARNDEQVWVKNMPAGLMIRYLHHKVLQELGGLIYFCVAHGKWKPYLRGKLDAFNLLPTMLRKRKAIQRRRKVSLRYIQSVLTPILSARLAKGKLRKLFIKQGP